MGETPYLLSCIYIIFGVVITFPNLERLHSVKKQCKKE